MVEKKLHTREFQLKGIGRMQNLADALSLKYIKLVIPKYSYWLYAILIFTSKLRDSPSKITPPSNNITSPSKIEISDSPPPQQRLFWNFLSPITQTGGRCMPWVIKMVCTKNFVQDKWAILGPKMAHPRNSGSTVKVFLKLCRMKGANRYMKILLAFFEKKIHLGQFDLCSI